MGYNIAIDGPAGAGKSTIAKLVAKELGYIYVDTGAMYRGMAIYFLQQKIGGEEKEKIAEASRNANVSIAYEDGAQQIYLNGENVTAKLREVRGQLLVLQRNLAQKENVVMDGRDIGTNILPHADTKIYLTASVETRAKRRFLELEQKGVMCNMEDIAKDIEERDYRDMHRDIAPLRQAEDAIYVDSSNMTIEEVVKEILSHCKGR